jgi:hypothetical protein
LRGRAATARPARRRQPAAAWWLDQPPEDALVFALGIGRAQFVEWDTKRGVIVVHRWSPEGGYSHSARTYPQRTGGLSARSRHPLDVTAGAAAWHGRAFLLGRARVLVVNPVHRRRAVPGSPSRTSSIWIPSVSLAVRSGGYMPSHLAPRRGPRPLENSGWLDAGCRSMSRWRTL